MECRDDGGMAERMARPATSALESGLFGERFKSVASCDVMVDIVNDALEIGG